MTIVMKHCFILLLVLVGLGLKAEEPTNYLSIHWVEKSDEGLWRQGKAHLTNLTAQPQAILSDRDFISFNTKSGEFFIRADTAKRLSSNLFSNFPDKIHPPFEGGSGLYYELWGGDRPFVLKAMNEQIFVGVFTGDSSSASYSSPQISANLELLPASATNDVGFRIGGPLSDERIAAALEKLFPGTNASPKSPLIEQKKVP